MNPLPTKLRHAIVSARGDGLTYDAIAEMLGVGRASVSRVLRLHRETKTVEPRARGGGNTSPLRGRVARLLKAIIDEAPDATVAELTAALMARTDVQTSRSGVQRALDRLGYTRKKSPSSRSNATRPSTGCAAASSARSSPR